MSVDSEPTVFLFPIRNEHGFRVDSVAAYDQLLYHIMHTTAELQEEYPDKQILVTYVVDEDAEAMS